MDTTVSLAQLPSSHAGVEFIVLQEYWYIKPYRSEREGKIDFVNPTRA